MPPETGVATQPIWINGDFESDSVGSAPTGWIRGTHLNPGITDTRPSPQTLASLNLAAGGTQLTLVVGGATETQIDPDMPEVGTTLRFPKYGQRAARVNSTAASTGASNNVNTMVQAMTVGIGDVDSADNKVHVRFAIAPVLQNPGHTYTSQPYYFVQLQNVTKNLTIYQDFNISGQNGVPWKNFTDTSGQAAQYTDWMLVDVSPGDAQLAVGDQVELTVTAAGCSLGGHWGHVYVDAVGSGVPGLFAWASGPQQANAGSTITYTINYKNGGTTTTAGTTLDLVTPPDTTFQSVSLGAACTTPAVGGTGTVSCPLGTLAPGSTGSFQVTVTIPPATPDGTVILNGNYSVYATGVTPLIGPKVYTTVTSSISYADVGVTLSDGIAALGWGQATTYQLTVSNAGPVAASSVTVADTMPAQLSNVTWTCAGAGGGTCAASGSGSINDAVSLPVGAQVQYTISATIVAGSGNGQVVHTASANIGGAVSDPDSTNNTAVDTNAIGNLQVLSFTKSGSIAAGGVSSTPASIACGPGCASASGQFLEGSQVVLTSAPVAGAIFNGWGGACSGTATTCTVTMNGDLGVTATFTGPSVTATGGDNQTTAISTAFATQLTVRVTDSNGTPVVGAVVTFTAPGSGASATLSAATATTDAQGFASVTATANGQAGGYQVIASAAGASSAAFSLSNLGPPASLSISAGDAQSAVVSTPFGGPLVALVRDAANQPVSGVTVTFTAPGSGASATLGSPTAVTNASGLASITATAGTVTGSYSVGASAGALSTSFSLTNTPGAPATLTLIAPTTRSATVGAPLGTFTAELTDSFGNLVPGIAVAFAAPGAGASASLSAPTATTDGNGRASITATAGTIAGSYAITASATGVTSQPFSITNAPGAPATLTLVSGDGQSAAVTTGYAAQLVVRVRDAFANDVPGVSVAFAAPGSGASATVPATVTTDASGLASASATAGTVAGNFAVTASVAGLPPVPFSLTNLAGGVAAISVVSGSGQRAEIEDAFAQPLRVVVRDAHGNPVPGATVSFAAPGSGAAATVSSSGTTGADGTAQTLATANSIAGDYTITASVSGAATPALFQLGNDAAAPASIEVSAGDAQQTLVDTAFAQPLVALVRDHAGNPAPGATVRFLVPAASPSAILSAEVVTTDGDGLARVTAAADTRSGDYAVSAELSPTVTAAFALRNLPDAPAQILVAPLSSPQSATVLDELIEPLAVQVVDRFGNPVPGVTVNFAAPAGGATATLSGLSAVTGADGRCQVTATASATAGSYLVNAAVAGIADPAPFSLTNLAGGAALVSLEGGSEQSAEVDTDFAEPLAVLVVDAQGNPVPGAVVTYTAASGAATAILAASTVATGADGRAAVTARASTASGAHQVTAVVVGAATPVVFDLVNTPSAPAAVLVRPGATPQQAQVATPYARALAVVVVDRFDNPVPGVAISYAVPASGATGELSATTTTSDADGEAAVFLTAGTLAGGFEATATVSGLAPARFSLTNLAGPAHLLELQSGGSQLAEVAAAFAAPLVIRVVDSFGNPVPGEAVSFAAPAGGATATLTPASAVSDAQGLVTVDATASTVTGAYQIVVTSAQSAAPLLVALTNTPGAPAAAVAAPGGTPQTAAVTAAFAAPLAVIVTDRFGNRVPGVVITFTGPSGPGATLSAPSATTAGDGVAQVLAAADTTTGRYQVVVVVPGVAEPVVFELENAPSTARYIVVDAGAGQATMATTSFAAQLVFRVLDSFGNPVPGAALSTAMTRPGPGAALTSTSTITDAAGRVRFNLLANDRIGTFAVTASAEGTSGLATAIFEITPVPTEVHLEVPASARVDQRATATIRVTAPLGVPGELVELLAADGRVLATATLSGGTAEASLELASRGQLVLTARFPAQGMFAASRSAAVSLQVTQDGGSLSGSGCNSGGAVAGLLPLGLALALLGLRRKRHLVRQLAALAFAAAALQLPAAARADDLMTRSINRYHAAAAGSSWFASDSLEFDGHVAIALSATADYAHRPLVIYNADEMIRVVVVRSSLLGHLGASLTLRDDVRLSTSVPMAFYQEGDSGAYNGMAMPGPSLAFGDMQLAADLRAYGSRHSAIRAAVGLRVTLPTGQRSDYMSDSEFAFEPRGLLAVSRGRLELGASLGAFLRQKTEMAAEGFGSELRYTASAGVRLLDQRLLLGPELIGAVSLVGDSATGSPTELGGGGHYRLQSGVQLGVGATAGIVNAVGVPDLRFFFSASGRL